MPSARNIPVFVAWLAAFVVAPVALQGGEGRLRTAPEIDLSDLEPNVTAAVGADVAVSGISVPVAPGMGNGFGAFNNINAFAIGTTSCNVGTVNLRWEPSTPRHPVIAQNMYRLKDGKFEHIGMAWVKHGFLAENTVERVCGSCDNPGGPSQLGVGCSDLYNAGLNAERRRLGPRSEINAFTGRFDMPYGVCPTETVIDGRLQVHFDDLDTSMNPEALYFVEGHYVAADDAAAGNAENNASWREIQVHYMAANGFYSMSRSETAALRREEPAIFAWKEKDPEVEITRVRVPGEGLFLVGVRVTELGTGYWRYEYAVQNFNSDRSAARFRVPIPDDPEIRNVGFHDVDYHTGEPYDPTDWIPVEINGGLEWVSSPFDKDENGNALRWSTLYNFRFDINAEPVPSTLILGLFKPGPSSEIGFLSTGPKLEVINCNANRGNTLPDSCDLDCGPTGGECDLPGCGKSFDCNGNDIPDECELDCNRNGLADSCDIRDCMPGELWCADCLPNGVPDGCESDCDDDGIPDPCDGSDMDEDGVIDCDDDCPKTSPADSCVCPQFGACCQQARGFCVTFLPGGMQIPGCDCCAPGDGICYLEMSRAQCEIIGGVFECVLPPCRHGCLIGDADSDGDRDLSDLASFQNCFSGADQRPEIPACLEVHDKDDDDDVDEIDYREFMEALNREGP